MDTFPRWLIAALALAALVILAGGAWFYHAQEHNLQHKVEDNLQAIAQLKANQIVQWRASRLGDAAVIMERPFLQERVVLWMADPQAGDTDRMLAGFRSLKKHYGYHDVLLVDADAQVCLSLSGYLGPLRKEAAEALSSAFREQRPVIADLHVGPGDVPPHTDTIAPFFATKGQAREPVGAIILQSDVRRFLYPLIQSWPTPSRTAETLLVRRDGDAVLFLNDLRHKQDTAFKLRIPLSQRDVPAVMAVLGKEGIVQGKDYRGVKVLSALKAIPDSPWFMVAKIDTEEAFADWRFRSVLILALILGLMGATAAAVGMVFQRNGKAHYQALFQAEAARLKSEERYRITLLSVGDGVVSTDAEGRVELLNPVAEDLIGWPLEEARGKPLEEVFRIVNEETRKPVENPVSRVVREGVVVGLANHTLLIARDGAEHPIADSGAPIRDNQGDINGAVLIFRDQTQERAAQKQLQREKDRAQQYLDIAGIMLIMLDKNADVTMVNKKGGEILGYEEQDIIGKNWFEHFLPESVRDRIKGVFSRIVAGKLEMTEYLENLVLTRSGEERLIAWHNTIVKDESDAITGTLSSGEDITERRRSEDALRESEEKYRLLHESMMDGFVSVDMNGMIQEFNEAYWKMVGYEPEEIHGLSYVDLTPEKWHAFEAEVVEKQILKRGYSDIYEKEYQKKDGTIFPVELRTYLIRDAAGNPVGMWAIVRDITERKRSEQTLRQSEGKYRLVVENADEGIFISQDGIIKFPNSSFVAMTGYSEEDFASPSSLSFLDLVHPEERETARKNYLKRIHGEQVSSNLPYRLITKSGKELHIELNGVRTTWGGEPATLNFVRDVSERKRMESQLYQAQKMESVGRLAGGVAHDFNNILSVIMGHAEMAMLQVPPEEPIHHDLQQILKAAQRSADLTRQLLAFARKQTVSPEILDLNDTVGGMLKMLRRLIGEDIELRWVPGPGLWNVRVDPSQVDQILANLVVNSRDAIPGVGAITLQTENVTLDEAYCQFHAGFVPGEYVLLTVSDNGTGMDRETLAQIFEPFFTTKEIGKGTGLGLATIYGIVKQNVGFINVYSEPGQGTTFKIYLPRVQAAASLKPAAVEEKPVHGTETVLLVEDEGAILGLAKAILERHGYTVLTARTPGQAISLVEQHQDQIHLLITDVVMPEMNGRELYENISAFRPGLKVLFMSGYTADVIAHHGMLEEGVQFLEKPFTVRVLAEKVREMLDRNQ